MKRGAIAGSIWMLLLALPVAAQYMDYDAGRRGWTSFPDLPSVRLAGMGGLEFTVRDENNELNPSDFGGNLAGVVFDRQGWTIDTWGGRLNHTRDRTTDYLGESVRQRDRFDQQSGGLDVVYRRNARAALGVLADWGGHDARSRYGENSRVSGTAYRFLFGETFGRITAAVGAGLLEDNEDVVSPDVFAIRHTSKTRSGILSIASPLPFAGVTGSAQVEFNRVRIEGISADPSGYHDDRFDWRRPDSRVALSLTRPEGAARLAFGLKYSRLDRTGREEGQIRWADRFPSNPGRVNLALDVPIFEEKESGWEAAGRASYRLGPSLSLAGSARLWHFESKVDESPNTNYLGSRGESDLTRDAWRVGAGPMLTLRAQRLRIGAEGSFLRVKEDEVLPRRATTTKSREIAFRAGGEYLLPTRLALRVGYQKASDDADVDLPGTLALSNGATLGFGYVPSGGIYSLDVAGRVWQEEPDQPGTENRKAGTQDLMVSFRVLF